MQEYAAGTVPANKKYAAGTLSHVCRCWLAMLLCAGVPYNREKNKSLICTQTTHPPPHTHTPVQDT